MNHIRFLVLPVLVTLLAGCGGARQDRSAFVPPEGRYDARILRDNYGVPHVFGKTDADAAYALAFAHCEDDAENMEDGVLVARAMIASVKGKDFAKFDYIMQLFRVREFVEAKYETELSAEVRAVLEAYADGVNHYAALYPERMPNVELPVLGKEVVMGFTLKAPFFYELHTQLEKVMALETSPEVQHKHDADLAWLLPTENPFTGGLPIGSNSWAAGPTRNSDGHTRLCLNSHQPWDGPVAWYEAHIHSEEGWNMHGGTFPGGPMIFSGHDDFKGWCHTVNRPDLCEVYALEMNPDDANQYKYDGEWRELEVRQAKMTVRLWGGIPFPARKECLWSVHGPAVRTAGGVFAFRFAGLGEVKMVEQWFRMNKAKSFEEFYKAMEIQGLPSFNCMYADKTGKLFYAYNGVFPKRAPGYDWREILPGNTSEVVWEERLPFTAVPQMQDPASGFAQTCNATPYRTTDGPDNPQEAGFAVEMGVETSMTNRSMRALEVYGADPSLTPEEFEAYKYDTQYAAESRPAKERAEFLALEVGESAPLKEAKALLEAWNLRMDADNTSAPLAFLTCVPASRHENSLGMKPRVIAEDRGQRLRDAVAHLQRNYGKLAVPWGEFLRMRRGEVDAPLSGGPDVLRVVEGYMDTDGRLHGCYGDGLYMFVDWDPQGNVSSKALHNYGAASTDPESPHYDDQALMFSRQEMRQTLLTEADVRANLRLEYRPGDFKDAWYKHAK